MSTSKERRQARLKERRKLSCDNCGIKDDLEFFEHILDGIRLCADCASLPPRKVQKRGIRWVKVNGEYFPPSFPIAKRKA